MRLSTLLQRSASAVDLGCLKVHPSHPETALKRRALDTCSLVRKWSLLLKPITTTFQRGSAGYDGAADPNPLSTCDLRTAYAGFCRQDPIRRERQPKAARSTLPGQEYDISNSSGLIVGEGWDIYHCVHHTVVEFVPEVSMNMVQI